MVVRATKMPLRKYLRRGILYLVGPRGFEPPTT
jgi:hypothetical protein